MKKILYAIIFVILGFTNAQSATVVATVDGKPITDTDITARTKLMARQGKNSTDNRRQALQNIIDDNVKLKYAANFNAVPSEKDAADELRNMNLGEMTTSEWAMAISAMRANIAWQVIVARTILPTIDIEPEDINNEKISLEREHGLPVELTLVRLVDVPDTIVKKLSKPKNCDDAMDMATRLGGNPQKFSAVQYELSPEIRDQIAGLGKMNWSKIRNGNMFLICDSKKTKEYGKLDEIIKQNAMYKKSMFIADQQLKQLRRKAVIIINDDRYKL
jgi:hypothetical protein